MAEQMAASLYILALSLVQCLVFCNAQTIADIGPSHNCSHPAALLLSVCGQLSDCTPHFLNHTGVIDHCPQAAAVLRQALLYVSRNKVSHYSLPIPDKNCEM